MTPMWIKMGLRFPVQPRRPRSPRQRENLYTPNRLWTLNKATLYLKEGPDLPG